MPHAGGSRHTRLALKFDSQTVLNLGQPTIPNPYAAMLWLWLLEYFVVVTNISCLDKWLSLLKVVGGKQIADRSNFVITIYDSMEEQLPD